MNGDHQQSNQVQVSGNLVCAMSLAGPLPVVPGHFYCCTGPFLLLYRAIFTVVPGHFYCCTGPFLLLYRAIFTVVPGHFYCCTGPFYVLFRAIVTTCYLLNRAVATCCTRLLLSVSGRI